MRLLEQEVQSAAGRLGQHCFELARGLTNTHSCLLRLESCFPALECRISDAGLPVKGFRACRVAAVTLRASAGLHYQCRDRPRGRRLALEPPGLTAACSDPAT